MLAHLIGSFLKTPHTKKTKTNNPTSFSPCSTPRFNIDLNLMPIWKVLASCLWLYRNNNVQKILTGTLISCWQDNVLMYFSCSWSCAIVSACIAIFDSYHFFKLSLAKILCPTPSRHILIFHSLIHNHVDEILEEAISLSSHPFE